MKLERIIIKENFAIIKDIFKSLYNNNKMYNIEKSTNKINQLYDKLNYFDVYSGSVIIFIVLCIILFLVISYFFVMKNIQPIKDNWNVERCKPQIIPFAGFINKPNDTNFIDFTQENFTYCTQNILTSITGTAVEPITFATSALTQLYNDIADSVNSIRNMLSNVRTNVNDIGKEILGRIANIMIPLQQILITFIDSMGKIQGILTTGLYTSLGTYYVLKSLMGAILQFIITILLVLSALILVMWIIPFTWPTALAGTAIFIGISIPLLLIMTFMNKVLHVDINSPIPSVPSRPKICFDGSTQIEMLNGLLKPIYDINVGDILSDNATVTAKITLDSTGSEMFDLNGIIVSGTHRVKYNNEWIYISNHPHVKRVSNYKEKNIFCLNTDNKEINIGQYIFADWDEVFEKENIELKNIIKTHINDKKYIHQYFDGGFIGTTNIELYNGNKIEIQNIKPGCVLKNREKVYGLVEIKGNDICENNLASLNLGLNSKFKEDKYFHLLTNTKKFYIGNQIFNDYNYCIEKYLSN
jgi:hypothetical protein